MELFVYIIESLRPEDIRNRKNQALGDVLAQTINFLDIATKYNFVSTKAEFVEVLTSKLSETMLEKKKFPILHFSMHGDEHCIQLADYQIITWEELRGILSVLSQEMGDFLMICMSTCYGFSGCQMAMGLDNKITFDILIGNDNELGFNESLIAYMTFYHRLLKGNTISDSVEAMRKASGDNNFRYISGIDAQKSYLGYIRKQAYELALQRVQSATSQINDIYFLSDFSNKKV